jgi:hypothetical protein
MNSSSVDSYETSSRLKSFEEDMESTAYNEGITELNAEFDEDVESDTDSESIEPDDEMEKEYNVSQLEEKSLVSRHFDF